MTSFTKCYKYTGLDPEGVFLEGGGQPLNAGVMGMSKPHKGPGAGPPEALEL